MTAFLPDPGVKAEWANWRIYPASAHGFTHVDSILRTETISAGGALSDLPAGEALDLSSVAVAAKGGRSSAAEIFRRQHTQGLIVLRAGRIIAEHYGHGQTEADRHIVFSVTKSITALIAGILHGRGLLDPDAPVTAYLPDAAGSAYGDCTVRHVLDMQVSVRFVEDYVDPKGDVARYRVATGYNPRCEAQFDGGTRDFVLSLPKGEGQHGERFHYVSPNTDCLGLILEAASGKRFAELVSTLLWRPMGAEADAAVTVDKFGAPRTAGGSQMRLRDMARIGELMRQRGRRGGEAIVPGGWIEDIWHGGSAEAWAKGVGDMSKLMPGGRYRSKWYALGDRNDRLCAIGIHGQWIYIDPVNEVVIARQACQPVADDFGNDAELLAAFAAVSDAAR